MRLIPILPIGYGATYTSPANPAALPLWLDGFDINLVGDAGIADNDPIGTWKNKGTAGATLDVTQAAAGQKPLFKASYINAHPAVLFDAVDDMLVGTASPVALQAARHIFAVVAVPAIMAGTRTYYVPRGATNDSYALRLANNRAAFESNFTTTDNNIPAALATGLKTIVEISFDGVTTNNPTFVTNGVAKAVTNGAGVGVGAETAVAGMLIGNAFGEAIGELLCYSGVQSAGDVLITRAYLSAKWGIAA